MITTTLEEVVNGWIVTIFSNAEMYKTVYEKLEDAQKHRNSVEKSYVEKGYL